MRVSEYSGQRCLPATNFRFKKWFCRTRMGQLLFTYRYGQHVSLMLLWGKLYLGNFEAHRSLQGGGPLSFATFSWSALNFLYYLPTQPRKSIRHPLDVKSQILRQCLHVDVYAMSTNVPTSVGVYRKQNTSTVHTTWIFIQMSLVGGPHAI